MERLFGDAVTCVQTADDIQLCLDDLTNDPEERRQIREFLYCMDEASYENGTEEACQEQFEWNSAEALFEEDQDTEEETSSPTGLEATLAVNSVSVEELGCVTVQEDDGHDVPQVACDYVLTFSVTYSAPSLPALVACGGSGDLFRGAAALRNGTPDDVINGGYEKVTEEAGTVELLVLYALTDRGVPRANIEDGEEAGYQPKMECQLWDQGTPSTRILKTLSYNDSEATDGEAPNEFQTFSGPYIVYWRPGDS